MSNKIFKVLLATTSTIAMLSIASNSAFATKLSATRIAALQDHFDGHSSGSLLEYIKENPEKRSKRELEFLKEWAKTLAPTATAPVVAPEVVVHAPAAIVAPVAAPAAAVAPFAKPLSPKRMAKLREKYKDSTIMDMVAELRRYKDMGSSKEFCDAIKKIADEKVKTALAEGVAPEAAPVAAPAPAPIAAPVAPVAAPAPVVATKPMARQAVGPMTNAIKRLIDHNIHAINNHNSAIIIDRFVMRDEKSGIAAGNAEDKMSVWVSAFGGKAKQRKYKSMDGYKSDNVGVTIGYDVSINDDAMIGAMVTTSRAHIEQNAATIKADTYMFGLYGLYDLTSEAFVQAVVNAGKTKVAGFKYTDANKHVVDHKGYNIINYGAAITTGYNYICDQMIITPTVGLIFNHFHEGSTKERLKENSDSTIAKRNYSKIAGRAGVKFALPVVMNEYKVTPSLNLFMNHDFNNKAVNIKQVFDDSGNSTSVKSGKGAATSYNTGLGLNIKKDNFGIDLSYNLELKSKFVGHQGAIKLKIDF